MAVVFILYGSFLLFIRNFRQSAAGQTMPRPRSMRTRIERVKAVLPAYIVMLAGAIMLVASFVR